MWKCQNCGADNQGDICSVCGVKNPELTVQRSNNYCAKCGSKIDASIGYCQFCNPGVIKPTEKSSKKLVAVLISAIAVLIVLLVILCCFFMINQNSNDENYVEPQNVAEETVETEPDVPLDGDDYDEPEPYEPQKPGKPDEATDITFINNNHWVGFPGGFGFAYGVTSLNTNPTYGRSTENLYYCDIPDNFMYLETVGSGNNITKSYAPTNQTALMQLVVQENTAGDDVTTVKNRFWTDVGGTVTYSPSGDDWFAMSIENGDDCYYIKGFVDDYIREFIFCFPKEYMDVYSGYVEHIEDNYKTID